MGKVRRSISVFIASPGDLAPEREAFKKALDSLNKGFGDGAGVEFEPLGWEDVLATTGRRSQGIINREVDRCDVFLLVLHRRWGQPAPDSKASSYTEEEFELAMARWRKTGKPEVMVFFKNVDAASMADAGPELKKVLRFRKGLEKGRDTLYRTFGSDGDFGDEVDKHLRAFARGDWNDVPVKPDAPAVSGAPLDKPPKAGKRIAKKADQSLVQAHLAEVSLGRTAVEAANAGRIQEATLLFAKATEGTTDLQLLEVAADFYRQVGQLENASRLVRRQSAIAKDRTIAARHLLALMPAGWLRGAQQQFTDQLLKRFPEEAAAEIRSIAEEVFGDGRLEAFTLDLYARHYTAGELTLMAQMYGTAEGQSMLAKMPQVMSESAEFGAHEFERVLAARRAAQTIDMPPVPPRLE